ncbi:MAG: glutamate--tRNA ligase, partial [Nanoarchaeota archaeon]
PGPSKHPHAGHAVSFGINYLYAQSYDGQCILRFDDTNPEVEKQEFVDAIKEDIIDYLGMKPTKIVFASDHIGTMIEKVEELIKDHHIYACSCPSESISKDRKSMKECPHRSQTRNETKCIWDEMKEGRKKNYALRLRIDMAHKNAVMRDPVIFRVITTPHYRQKKKYTVWPMYDFESPFMDGYLGITHVMRSNEFDSRIELHHYIAELLGFPKIPYKHYGRISITGSLTKGREIREKIEKGNFIGWDDPRLVTLKALRRRGITKEALHNLAKTAGMSKQNTNIDFSVIASENRKILDESAHRFFFIKKPKKVTIEGAPSLDNELHLHPEHARGGRRMRSTDTFYIEEDDCKQIKEGEICRLMDCLNFTKKGNRFIYHSTPYEEYKGKGRTIIHWLPAGEKLLDVEVFMPDATTLKGLGEPAIKTLKKDAIIQFERFGFCRLDAIDKKEQIYRFWYTHD